MSAIGDTGSATDVEYILVTGSGNDPYTALDRFDRTVNLVCKRAGVRNLVDYTYSYDCVGNKLTQKVNGSPAPTNVDEFYGYDQLYRLLEYDRGQLVSGSITNPTWTQDWTLDQTGNWNNFQQGVVDPLDQDRTHNTTNEITAIAKTVGDVWPTPAYDANGNMAEFPQTDDLTSSYDASWHADIRIDFEGQ